MQVQKHSFFRIFQAEIRPALRWFFENRKTQITREMATEFCGVEILEKLSALELIDYDTATAEYRLDDRVEQFFDQMVGSVEVTQAEWLVGIFDELKRSIEGCQKLTGPKAETFLHRTCRLLRTANTRLQRHLEELKAAVDFDYRAGSDYETKLLKLKWHLERAQSFGQAVSNLDNLLRNDSFFHVHQEVEVLSIRGQLIRRCTQVGDALIDIYQRIEEYLNRVLRNFERARKLIQLCGLLDHFEHLTTTNILDVARNANGPWFHEFSFRTLLEPSVIDGRPELLERVLSRMGVGDAKTKPREVEIDQEISEEIPSVVDWEAVYHVFTKQGDDLFTFLGKLKVEGRHLTEEERIDGYCAVLTNEDWSEAWDTQSFEMGFADEWEYAVVKPPALLRS